MRPQSHFRNRRCLAGCRRRLGRAFALKPAEEASSITLQIGGRGSRDRHSLPDRPPTLQAFRSVLSRTPSVSTQRLINGSRSYLRCHGVQSRGAPLWYHKPAPAVYPKIRQNQCRCKLGDILCQVCTAQSRHSRLRCTPLSLALPNQLLRPELREPADCAMRMRKLLIPVELRIRRSIFHHPSNHYGSIKSAKGLLA